MQTNKTVAYCGDLQTWETLFSRQWQAVKDFANAPYIEGMALLNFSKNQIPTFDEINDKLHVITAWRIYPVPGLIANDYFFDQLYDKKFGITNWLRKPAQIDYLEEPDMFHDVFGHIPHLTNPFICNYLFQLAALAKAHNYAPVILEAIARLYWYTVEFGLVKENGAIKIYGAGIMSSIAETAYCFSNKPSLLPFDIELIIQTPYIKDDFQKQYFVLESFTDLSSAVNLLQKEISNPAFTIKM